VIRYFQETPIVKQIFFSAADASLVVPITAKVQRVIQSRHRPESVYSVRNLTQLVSMADKIATAMTLVLLAVSLVVLLVSGIGIMNIMLATVSARIREIGIRKAMGATNREIRSPNIASRFPDSPPSSPSSCRRWWVFCLAHFRRFARRSSIRLKACATSSGLELVRVGAFAAVQASASLPVAAELLSAGRAGTPVAPQTGARLHLRGHESSQ
jgi:hypothetical protein